MRDYLNIEWTDFDSKVVNREFLVKFRPKDAQGNELKSRLIGGGQLPKHVGQENAFRAVLRALRSGEDKTTIKLRKYGRIDFYTK